MRTIQIKKHFQGSFVCCGAGLSRRLSHWYLPLIKLDYLSYTSKFFSISIFFLFSSAVPACLLTSSTAAPGEGEDDPIVKLSPQDEELMADLTYEELKQAFRSRIKLCKIRLVYDSPGPVNVLHVLSMLCRDVRS